MLVAMRLLTLLRRKIPWLLASAAVMLVCYIFWNRNSEETKIPILRKSISRGGKAMIYGPFNSASYENRQADESITLVTHTSLRNLYYLQRTMAIWRSPISVAVWAHGDLTGLIELSYLLTLSCSGTQSLRITIVVPTIAHHNLDVAKINWEEITSPSPHTCSQRAIHNRLYKLRALEPAPNYDSKRIPYPNNYLRNIAAESVKTSHLIVVDIDIIVSIDMDKLFLQFLHREQRLLATRYHSTSFVVPVFESDQPVVTNWTIELLQKGLQAGHVRPFYSKMCPQCQGATQYANWVERQTSADTSAVVAHQVKYVPGWEPFIITRTDAHPGYDERFTQFGYNRMSMICTIYMSGGNFAVLDQVFLMHDGFKEEDSFHAEKDMELKKNEKLYIELIGSLTSRYGTARLC